MNYINFYLSIKKKNNIFKERFKSKKLIKFFFEIYSYMCTNRPSLSR